MENNGSEKNLQDFYKQLKNAEKDLRNKNLYKFLLKRVEGDKVLDIGSGAGHFLKILESKGYEANGIEPDKKLIEISKSIYKSAPKIKNLKAEELDNLKGRYDSVSMIDVLEHIEDDKKSLKKIKSILNNDGRLVIFVPAYQFLYSERDKEIGHFRRYSMKELKSKLKSSGYKIEETRYWNMIGFFVYLLFEKLLNKSLNRSSFRTNTKKGIVKSTARKILDSWMSRVENNVNFGFGLSLLVVAEKK